MHVSGVVISSITINQFLPPTKEVLAIIREGEAKELNATDGYGYVVISMANLAVVSSSPIESYIGKRLDIMFLSHGITGELTGVTKSDDGLYELTFKIL